MEPIEEILQTAKASVQKGVGRVGPRRAAFFLAAQWVVLCRDYRVPPEEKEALLEWMTTGRVDEGTDGSAEQNRRS